MIIMANAYTLNRAHLIYGLCLLLALLLGDVLAEPLESTSLAVVVLVLSVMVTPLLMTWYDSTIALSVSGGPWEKFERRHLRTRRRAQMRDCGPNVNHLRIELTLPGFSRAAFEERCFVAEFNQSVKTIAACSVVVISSNPRSFFGWRRLC
jgi:hypothetical protein